MVIAIVQAMFAVGESAMYSSRVRETKMRKTKHRATSLYDRKTGKCDGANYNAMAGRLRGRRCW